MISPGHPHAITIEKHAHRVTMMFYGHVDVGT